ncbi:hypothetical protein [Agromyces sp. Soil535]|uniref:hypothetical protein n=1 Tax=Agromyces sp. Soil535 TaxID=1736390 RepID=UPI0006FC0D10|nr:hypothetical protein [Agromyces sp. Soil535]KRE22333.1 hypothetical protein ASG80_10360 [Agromyces sp. Soil535]
MGARSGSSGYRQVAEVGGPRELARLEVGEQARRPSIPHDKVQTFVMVRDDDTWRCAAFQNTRKQRLFIAMNRIAMNRLADASAR